MEFCYHCMCQIENRKAHTCPHCGKSLKPGEQKSRFLKPGTILGGKFIIGEPLGAGGFGNTYIGWDSLLFRRVAVKEFYPEQYCSRDGATVHASEERLAPRFAKGLGQFLNEARHVAALHEVQGVVEITDFFEENGTGYIVMEYLEGMDVKTILKKSGDKKDYEWCRRVILTVLYTLREIHRRGVLHRDIAPDNIFVTDEGIIKLIDFGAAKNASLLESNSDIMLKTGYAPIEQYSRNREQGAYTDIYAVAALFYRMLTGQTPIPANKREAGDTLISPSQMGVELPEEAEMAIMVCLNWEPEYRLQSTDEFMEALDGKYFVPVYEPEWILPPVDEKKGIWERLSAMPAVAKAALCLLCICIVGGGAFSAAAFIEGRSAAASLNEEGRIGIFTMGDYRGQKYEDVLERLAGNGIENIEDPEYVLNDSEEGTVVRQNIAPSASVSKEDTLKFTVSGGDSYYTMPDFSGMELEEVIQYYTEKNFDVRVYDNPCQEDELSRTEKGKNDTFSHKKKIIAVKSCFSADAAEGVCFAQSVKAGKKCGVDKKVTLSVSVGGEMEDFNVGVPDFIGLTVKQANTLLETSGLKGILEAEMSGQEEEGACVQSQDIAAGKAVNRYQDKGRKLRLKFGIAKEEEKEQPEPSAQEPASTSQKASAPEAQPTPQPEPSVQQPPPTPAQPDSRDSSVHSAGESGGAAVPEPHPVNPEQPAPEPSPTPQPTTPEPQPTPEPDFPHDAGEDHDPGGFS